MGKSKSEVAYPVHPDIEAFQKRVKDNEYAIKRIEEENEAYEEEILLIVAIVYNKGRPESEHVISGDLQNPYIWNCPKGSPTGHCVYDDDRDPNHDSCLFCGDPRERK